ncbi:MAG: hypothetical protein A2987_05840 [Omnitrophica bacterium RIFCSPLOWO2_01_FULL_45_10]|nr:MAG: hypothetical protein A2987_05840 [Omnitrophica bacterium RIFCSPLOWO2_01_FULL_45_10]
MLKPLSIYLFIRKILLFILSLFIVDRACSSFDKEKVSKILVIRLDRIGDFMITTPLLKALKARFPLSEITLLARPNIRDLAGSQPWVDKTISFKGKLSILALFKLGEKIKKENFDLSIDCLFDYTLKTAFLCYLSRARYILGFDIDGRGVFLNLKVKPSGLKMGIVDETLNLLNAVGIESAQAKPELFVDKKELESVNNFLSREEVARNDILVAVHPGGHYPSQRWPWTRFCEVIDNISVQDDVKVVLVGSFLETGLLESIKKFSKRGVRIFRSASLPSLAALIERSDLLVCNNSGPLHMAAALKKPTVSTMGPTDSILWRPAGSGHVVLKAEVECSPCNRPICREHKCMAAIEAAEVSKVVSLEIDRIRKKRCVTPLV